MLESEQQGKEQRTAASSDESECSSPQLGVLFVHGIGDQREGDTLTSFGEPIIDWIRDWINGHGMLSFAEPMDDDKRKRLAAAGCKPDGIEAIDSSLFPSLRQDVGPPHSLLEVRFKDERQEGRVAPNVQRKQRWIFAECWWGEQVQAPQVFALLGWLLSRGPWVVLAHFGERAYAFANPTTVARFGKFSWRQLRWSIALVQFLAVTALLQILLLMATLVALIPIPAVQRYVSAILQRATLILGDSQGLVANETQRSAILTRFHQTVTWLKDKCGKVIIIAHSQGAAVVNEAINDGAVDKADLLITFGAGIVKLSQLRQCETNRRGRMMAAGWIVPSLALGILLNIWFVSTSGEFWLYFWIVIGMYIAALACAIAAFTAWHETRIQTRDASNLKGAPSRWVDFYASSDPVPQGSLSIHLPRYGIHSERIINQRSFLSDHTTYWTNKPGFVSRVVEEIDREAQILKIPNLASSPAYQSAKKHHNDTIAILNLGWWTFMVSLLAWGVFRLEDLSKTGGDFLKSLEGTPLDFVLKPILAPGLIVGWLVEKATGSKPGLLIDIGHASVALAGAAIVGFLWWKAVVVVFTKWNRASLLDFFSYKDQMVFGRFGTLIVWPFMDLLAFLPLSVAFCLWVDISPWSFIVQTTSWTLVVTVAVVMLLALVQLAPKGKADLLSIQVNFKQRMLDATHPGDWKSFREFAASTITISVLLSIALEKIGVAEEASSLAIMFGILALAALLLGRLTRLVLLRGFPLWVGLAVCVVILGTATATMLNMIRSSPPSAWSIAVGSIGPLSLALSGIVYPLVSRFLPRRL